MPVPPPTPGGGDGVIKVNFHALGAAADDIKLHANSLMQQLEDLDNFIKPLTASWDSNASAAYHHQQKLWDQSMLDLQGILADLGLKVNDAYLDFWQTEAANAAVWA
jgi:WXG100 family type VII secretion target